MAALKYTVIKDDKQYFRYCDAFEKLSQSGNKNHRDEIELLELLIHSYEKEMPEPEAMDPIDLIQALMKDHGLKAIDLVDILELSKGTVSKILSRQTGLSKNSIRKLANYFKVSQEVLNQPYPLVSDSVKVED
ncbi:MAG: helix-turn-helix domain-containing protein [Bacteroidota bacterium]